MLKRLRGNRYGCGLGLQLQLAFAIVHMQQQRDLLSNNGFLGSQGHTNVQYVRRVYQAEI